MKCADVEAKREIKPLTAKGDNPSPDLSEATGYT